MSKRKSFLLICFAILFISTSLTLAKDQGEVVPVIALHLDYISLEKSLWDFLNSPSKHNESTKLDKIFEAHNAVVGENYTSDLELMKYSVLLNNHDWPNNVTEGVNYAVWSNTVETLIKFEGLFKYFRGFLNRYFENEYDKTAILDLCRDVLDDNENSVNIPGVIDQIQGVMLKLYYRAMLVCIFCISSFLHMLLKIIVYVPLLPSILKRGTDLLLLYSKYKNRESYRLTVSLKFHKMLMFST